MTEIATERFESFYADPRFAELLYEHWVELGKPDELDPDFERYLTLDRNDLLVCQTARSDGELIGYFLTFLASALHYKKSLHAWTDVYYIDHAHRNPFLTLRLFKFVGSELQKRGVKTHHTVTHYRGDPTIGRLWERLGYVGTETNYTKVL